MKIDDSCDNIYFLPTFRPMKKTLLFLSLISLTFLGGFYYTKHKHHAKKTVRTVTDNESYLQFCHQAALHEEIFKHFKRHPVYTLMQEGDSFEEGKQYAQLLANQFSDRITPDLLERFRGNDLLGFPRCHVFEGLGPFSPTTLRYIKIACELKELFGSPDGLRVVQIGGGYGGQCKILSDLFHFKSYTLIDHPESLALAKKYLDQLQVSSVEFVSLDEIPENGHFDLVISDFSFTESSATLQKKLLTQVLSKSKRGYLICNFVPKHYRVRPLAKEELLKEFKSKNISYELFSETPPTGKDHFVIAWK